jgi:hypothetical protein
MKISCAFDGTPYRDPGGEAKVALCAHGFCPGRRDWPFFTLRNHSKATGSPDLALGSAIKIRFGPDLKAKSGPLEWTFATLLSLE